MNNYKFDSIVNKQEAEALKEMIFKRARERAESMTKEVQESYTSTIKNDIMDLARDTFVSSKNPFSGDTEHNQTASKEKIGFPQRRIEEIKSHISYHNRTTSEEVVEETMSDAHNEFSGRTSFMGALNFLNSQASISLVNKHGKRFEAMA